MDEDYVFPERPWSIWLISLWSLARAISPILAIIGSVRLWQSYISPSSVPSANPYLPDWIVDVLFYWTEGTAMMRLSLIVGVITAIAFFYVAIGLFLGLSSARTSFLVVSGALIVWSLRLVLQPRLGPSIASSAAFLLAFWYFRQPAIDDYFGGDWSTPHFLDRRLLGMPLDFALSLFLLAVLGIFEVVGYLRLLR
jgi:hypothetical protein